MAAGEADRLPTEYGVVAHVALVLGELDYFFCADCQETPLEATQTSGP